MSVFSGPYTTLSPPPTAGPLPVIERANLNTPYSGGGGGGGPSTIGPNPVVSSITTNGGATANGWDLIAAGFNFNINGSTLNLVNFGGGELAGGQAFNINADTTPNIDLALFLSTTNTSGGNIQGTSLVVQSDGAVYGAASLGAITDGTCYIASYAQGTTPQLSTLNVYADAVNMSSLNVSSINGAAPGGGGSAISSFATASVSSLSVSSINGAAPSGGGAPPAVVSTISSLVNVSTINVGSPGLLTIAGGISVLDYVGAGSISTGSIVGIVPGGAVSVPNLVTSSITTGQPQLNIDAPTSVSSLIVSSINGAAPGGGGASLQYSTISNPIPNIVPVNPGATTQILSFSTIAGHVYSASVNARANITVVPASATDMLQSEILDNNVGNDFIGSWLCSAISTSAASGGFYQQIGGTINWKAAGTGASFAVYTQTSTSVFMDSLKVIDFGAI